MNDASWYKRVYIVWEANLEVGSQTEVADLTGVHPYHDDRESAARAMRCVSPNAKMVVTALRPHYIDCIIYAVEKHKKLCPFMKS